MLVLSLSNTSLAAHNIAIGAKVNGSIFALSDNVEVGNTAVFTVRGLTPGTYAYWCTIDNHAADGMIGTPYRPIAGRAHVGRLVPTRRLRSEPRRAVAVSGPPPDSTDAGLARQVALPQRDAELGDHRPLGFGLDPFGDDRGARPRREVDPGLPQRPDGLDPCRPRERDRRRS